MYTNSPHQPFFHMNDSASQLRVDDKSVMYKPSIPCGKNMYEVRGGVGECIHSWNGREASQSRIRHEPIYRPGRRKWGKAFETRGGYIALHSMEGGRDEPGEQKRNNLPINNSSIDNEA
ncbi:hypothetical protein SCLCIDRAFT_990547 [Scleroderma citrinum Foug A]|uniref:Uncharacterized protein n=1 Tax=Scleroderma citrinum Foug A TaxID=1036808 RepID=A0A0C3A4K6_9AGAM|nr:hypothetical protein SCLCIDRAFT_990547 [Scleroderma citrinum Foug A]